MPRLRSKSDVLPRGPKACLVAIRQLAAVVVVCGDADTMLRTPGRWPRDVTEAVRDAFQVLAAGTTEVPVEVVSACLNALSGMKLMKHCRIRTPPVETLRGGARNITSMRLREFTEAVADAASRSISHDAEISPLAKGKARLREQFELRQKLGVPVGTAAAAARVRIEEVINLLESAGVTLESVTRVRDLIRAMGRPLAASHPHLDTVGRSAPYLEVERLLISALTSASLEQLLRTPLKPLAPPPPPPLPEWYDEYCAAAAEASIRPLNEGRFSMSHPANLSRAELERWWLGRD